MNNIMRAHAARAPRPLRPRLLTGTLRSRNGGGGVIRGDDAVDYPFDPRGLSAEVDIDGLATGERVIFRIREGLGGPRAVQIRRA
jgi:hypothetical protein